MRNILLILLILPYFVVSQTAIIDSLFIIAKNSENSDSIRMVSYSKIVNESISSNAFFNIKTVYNEAIQMAKVNNSNTYKGLASNYLGLYYMMSEEVNYDSAKVYFTKAINFLENEQNNRRKGLIYNNLSIISLIKTDKKNSKLYAEKALKIGKEIKDEDLQTRVLQVLNEYYKSVNNYSKMLEVNNEALKLARLGKDTSKIALSLIQIGNTYSLLKEKDKAIETFELVLKDYGMQISNAIKKITHEELGSAYAKNNQDIKALENIYASYNNIKNQSYYNKLNSIAISYIKLKKKGVPDDEIPRLEKSGEKNSNNKSTIKELTLSYLSESIEGLKEINENEIVYPISTLGEYYVMEKDYNNAKINYLKAWGIANKNNLLAVKKDIANELYLICKKQNKFNEALNWHETYLLVKDSLSKKENQQSIGRQLAEFEYSNIRIEDSLQQLKKDEIQQIKFSQQEKNIKNEKLKKYYLYGGLGVVSFLLLFLFRRFKITEKQKRLIELQKAEMEKKQIELSKTHLAIKDSINYSKRIQKAIFPSRNYINTIFPENFILFQPKDVVSGDFYWCYETNNKKIFVLADCTGHGVPGAFMTIIGINILKEIIQEGVIDSAILLKEINTRLKTRLGQSEKIVKDGMDLGICIIDDKTIEFSGAHFPLYHISNNEFVEYKGNNFFLGSEENMENIKSFYIPYIKGDLIYMSTDGFPDQKGGVNGKKYYYQPLRDLIYKNKNLPMNEQYNLLKSEFENWININNKKQMDDVSIIGIKL